MGGMKDETKRITIPPLFPRVHVNDTGRGGLSQPFDGKTMSPYKHSTIPSPTNKFFDSPSTLSLSLPPSDNTHLTDGPVKNQFLPIYNTYPALLEGNANRKDMNYPSPRGLSVTNTKPSSIKQDEYHFKNLTNLDSLKVPVFRLPEKDPKAHNGL